MTFLRLPDLERRNFGMVALGDYIYAIGGKMTRTCERFSLKDLEWEHIAPMREELEDMSVCTFRDRYILRIGGRNAFGFLDRSIEM